MEFTMDKKIFEIAQRIKTLREILEITTAKMAEYIGMSEADYISHENAENDFSFTFLHKCAHKFGVDIVELLTGENPRLSFFTITRSGSGPSINRRAGFNYEHMAANLKGKLAEPFIVVAPYSEDEQSKEILLSTHAGQEFDIVLSGSLKVRMEDHILILNEGDAIMYDSGHGHGMIATGGNECKFLAVVISK